jgi:hypothetical protein
MTQEISYIAPRFAKKAGKIAFDAFNDSIENEYSSLELMGINIPDKFANSMFAMDAIEPTVTTGSIPVPVQYLQNNLPGFVLVATAARKIDELVGISIQAEWEDEEVVQKVLELTGKAVPYGDYTNVPFSSWNTNFERRTIVRYEEGSFVGRLDEARSARIDIDSGAEKRNAAVLSLEIERNDIGFNGFNNGLGRTYGFLNDPSLSAYDTVPAGASLSTEWSTKTYLEITADLRQMISGLRTQSGDVIDPQNTDVTLALATDVVDYLSVTSDFGNSVQQWLNEAYPRIRVVSAPELNDANGGENVGYMYADAVEDGSTDGGRTWVQVVPTKFTVLGVSQKTKGYEEAYTNATAGVMLKRPYAVYRVTGI